ncbi:SDR family oxidoreductase [Mycolicibacterium fluoranthenivorans]|uniref:Uncharacterized conserved protein YbjT, contains NAD(P)-binding and DUF2867 domains n=1 Tax=Mycolicibacterium fluoranthenivorans TaxID=258505 RepID=A0A1G4WF71_9MYCO|nr:SDR family oxidoreductase [Mycolicibacterium fluoranthenivorans]SCX21790.1 Uncharacterized conserved protein YbjT, contains NAD(P)-binding and DUF2867 domains [Mycolicibacterium fluoranthenivorans]
MRIVVIGGTGLIGSKLVHALTEHGHDAVPASPRTGVNTVTGEGLPEALEGAEVVVDVSNSPTFEDAAAREFFTRSATNLLAAESAAGVGHHVALSVVGTPTLAQQSGYFDAKLTQEKLIAAGPVPHTVVRATQFFEFLDTIADSAAVDGAILLPAKGIQPMAAADVAEGVAIAALGDPVNGFAEIGGPERFTLPDLIRTALIARGDKRPVITDPAAKYWGIDIDDDTLVPGGAATFFETRFADWILEQAATH